MTTPYTGGCACGAIRYEIACEPLAMTDCQCRDCQHESGTGHASHLVFPRAGVTLTGEPTRWTMVADSGQAKTRTFCPTCGAPVSMTLADAPDIVVVRAGSLDDPARYRPQMVTYTLRAHPWDCIDPDLPAFERMPPM